MDLSSLDEFFTSKPLPPFSQTVAFENYAGVNNDDEYLFSTITDMFLYGMTIKQQNSEFPLDITKISMVQLKVIADYILSFGITTRIELFNTSELNHSHRLFADELSLYFNVFVTQNWTSNNIVYLTVKSNNKDIKKLHDICTNHKTLYKLF